MTVKLSGQDVVVEDDNHNQMSLVDGDSKKYYSHGWSLSDNNDDNIYLTVCTEQLLVSKDHRTQNVNHKE